MTEYERAKRWRNARGWTLDDLADLTGYSRSSIFWFERGVGPTGKRIDEFAWHRYKRICHSIDVDKTGTAFKWDPS